MKEYFILDAGSSDLLATYVIYHLNNGWELAGGVATVQIGVHTHFYQAVTRIKP